jgi:hypothetical protein
MIVLAGATGMSYKVHFCHGSFSGIAFYTELGIQKQASCGCKDDATPGKASLPANATILTKNSCCSNLSFFSKLDIESLTYDFSSLAFTQPAVLSIITGNTIQVNSEKEIIPVSDFKFRPPLLAGRKLVLFLSQQRIPFINYSC